MLKKEKQLKKVKYMQQKKTAILYYKKFALREQSVALKDF